WCEYSSAFHVVAMLVITIAPLLRQRRWRDALEGAAPQLFALILGALFYRWHLGGRFPLFKHTEPFVYSGAGVAGFFAAHMPTFFGGILPLPWGWLIPFLLLMGFHPRSRSLAAYAFIAIGFVFAAAVARIFPFGGIPRHTVVLVPGILMACVLGATAL